MKKREEIMRFACGDNSRQSVMRTMTKQEAQHFLQNLPDRDDISVIVEIVKEGSG